MWITNHFNIYSFHKILIFIIFFTSSNAIANDQFNKFYGTWHWQEKNIDVEVNACSYNPKQSCAIIIKGDRKGSYILESLTQKQDKIVGKMIHPIDGRTYNADIQMTKEDTVKISGCVGDNINCHDSIWVRKTQ